MRSSSWVKLSCVALALGMLAVVSQASAQQGVPRAPVGVVSNVKVISDKVEDVTTLEDWKRTYIKPDMSDNDKAIAIWKTVIKYRHQDGPPNECFYAGNVHDPMKTIHVYGYGMCCCAASNVEGLARYLGYPARGRIINAHSVPEIFYGAAWHLLDGSVMNYHVKDDGSIASVDDIREAVRGWFEQNPDLAKKLRGNDNALRKFALDGGWKNGPPLLAKCPYYGKDGVNDAGWHGWPSTMQEYDWSANKMGVFDYGPSMGYQVNVQLRPGEKLTRNWSNKGLHVNMPGGAPDVMNNTSVLGLQKKFGDVAPGRIGNGTLVYDVPLENGEFRSGALTAENLTSQGELNITLPPTLRAFDPAKPAVLVIRMPSSYVYLRGDASFKAAVGAGGAIVVSFSDNQGLDWKEIATVKESGEQKLDLSALILRRYDYRIKFEMTGAGTGLDTLVLRHDIQHSQAPLPAVLEGKNTITFAAGAQEGTITYEGAMKPDDAKGRQVVYTDFHPVLAGLQKNILMVGDTGTGTATFTLNTPGDMTRIRMNAHYRARDARDSYDVDLSFDNGRTWVKFDTLGTANPAASKYIVFDKVPAGTRQALLRLTGHQRNTACIFDMRMDADYKEPFGGFKPVKVTYVWTENGEEKTDVHVARQPKDAWTITCGAGTVPKSYTVELAQ